MIIPQSVRDVVATGPLAHITTLNQDGSPYVTVVWPRDRQAVSLPIIDREIVSGRAKTLDVDPNLTPFDRETWNIAD